MRQLTALDAQFLAMENGRVHGHVGMVAVLDPSTAPGGVFDAARLKELIARRIHLIPPFRWRLVRVPLDLDHPYWVEDPDFDLDYHVRDSALPPPGDERALGEMAAREAARPLDRARPLWEAQIVHGLPEGRVALMTKTHHAVIDGLSGAEILSVLLDISPEGRPEDAQLPERIVEALPSDWSLLTRSVLKVPLHPLRSIRALPGALPGLQTIPPLRPLPLVGHIAGASAKARKLAGKVTGVDGGLLEAPAVKAPRSRLNGHVSAQRRFSFGSLSLDTVKTIKKQHGVTVNDVVMALCAGALRRRLLATDELPTEPLVAMVPLSVRTPEQFGTYGNKISMLIVPIPTNLAEPLARLRAAHEAMNPAKEHHQALPASLLQDVAEFIPPVLFTRATRTMFQVGAIDRFTPSVNVVISNVPGAPFPLYCGGAKVETTCPVSVLFEGIGLNITVLSYEDHLDFGLLADRSIVPDVWELMDDLRASLDELAGLPAAGG